MTSAEWVCNVSERSLHFTSESLLQACSSPVEEQFRARGEKETFTRISFSYRWRSVGVAQHGMEGAGKVVGMMAAVVLLGHGHKAGQADEE